MAEKPVPTVPTPEEIADLQSRVQSFNEELIPLLGKYHLGLTARAIISPEGLILAQPHLFNDPPKTDKEPATKVDGGIVKSE